MERRLDPHPRAHPAEQFLEDGVVRCSGSSGEVALKRAVSSRARCRA
ncbi:MAG: hypothetical protein R3F36_12615 [Candidatus Competibacteraceae bacterium]